MAFAAGGVNEEYGCLLFACELGNQTWNFKKGRVSYSTLDYPFQSNVANALNEHWVLGVKAIELSKKNIVSKSNIALLKSNRERT